MDLPTAAESLVTPLLANQFGQLSVQDKAFLNAFSRQEQQELHGVPRPDPVDPGSLLGQLEQVVGLHNGDKEENGNNGTNAALANNSIAQQHEYVEELSPEEVRWFYKRDLDKMWTPFLGYDSLRLELRHRHVQAADRGQQQRRGHGPHGGHGGRRMPRGARRTQSLNRGHYRESNFENDNDSCEGYSNNYDEYVVQPAMVPSPAPNSPHHNTQQQQFHYPAPHQGVRGRGGVRGPPRRAEDQHVVVVRGGVFEVNLVEFKCNSIYWPGESFDVLRGTWFHEHNWQPVATEVADKVEKEHLDRFRGHKIADYEAVRNEKQVYHTASFPEFHVDWLSPSQTYLHRETTSSQLYRGLSSSLGFRKPSGERLCRGYREFCRQADKLSDIGHLVFVVHGVGQVMDDTTIIRNTNLLREHFNSMLSKRNDSKEQLRVEFFPVEWRSSLKLDEGMVRHVTPQRIMGLRNLLNSSAMDIMYYTSPLYRMEIYQTLQEELNRLYEMFVQRHPNFENNQGKVSIVAHSLGCVVAYDILTGFTLDVEAAWQGLQARNVSNELKIGRRLRMPGMGGQTGLLFRIEHFFCLGSPLSVFLLLRWRDPTNQEYHEHILPRSLCKFLYNVYHPCDPVAYRIEPIFMKFYSKVEPVHVVGSGEALRPQYSQQPLFPLQNARKEETLNPKESNKSKVSLTKMLPNAPKAKGANIGEDGQERSHSPSVVKEAVNQVAGEVLGGVWDRMRDAVKTADTDMARINAHLRRAATMDQSDSSPSTSSTKSISNCELRPPDGQRLAYRMDYVLRETGNTYIAAMVSHTSYWSNPDVARFMVDKIYPEDVNQERREAET